MALDARQAARGGPAPVAIHDDGDMARHLEEPSPLRERLGARFSIAPRRSNRHDLLFLAGEHLLDVGDGRVGRLLHFAGLPLVVVFADLVVLLELLEKIETVAAHMADGDARGLRRICAPL